MSARFCNPDNKKATFVSRVKPPVLTLPPPPPKGSSVQYKSRGSLGISGIKGSKKRFDGLSNKKPVYLYLTFAVATFQSCIQTFMLFESPFLWKKRLFNRLIFLKGRYGWIWVFLVHPGKANNSHSFVPRDTSRKNEERDLKQSSLVTSDKMTLSKFNQIDHIPQLKGT